MSETPRESLFRLRWTLCALGAGLLPHVLALPPWIVAGVTATALWRLVIAHRQAQLPGRFVRFAGAVVALAGVRATFRTAHGLQARTAPPAPIAPPILPRRRVLRSFFRLHPVCCFLL